MRSSKLTFIALLLCVLFLNQSNAQTKSDNLHDQLIVEAERVSDLLEWDSSFVDDLNISIQRLNQLNKDSLSNTVVKRLLSHYQSIERNNKSRVKLDFEEVILTWLTPMISFLEDPKNGTEKIIKGLPDTYYPAKILAPELLTDSALTIAADLYPKELMYNVRFMTQADALFEIELAAINAPYATKQYLHYFNNVNSLLKASSNPKVKKLYEIYAAYGFSSKSLYLFDAIYKEQLSIKEAQDISLDRELFYNALVDIYINGDDGKQSVIEQLSEISDKYVRKLSYQRYLSQSSIKMEPFEVLTNEAKTYFLFNNQNLLKKQDLKNLVKLYLQEEMPKIDVAVMDWLPIELLHQMEERLDEEQLRPAFDPLISYSLWAKLNEQPKPVQQINIYEPISSEEETVIAEPEFVFNPYHISLSYDDKEFIKFKNNPYESLKDLSQITGKMHSRKILMSLAQDHPVEVMGQLDKFISEPYASEICTTLAKNAPLTIKNYLVKKDHKIHYFLKESKDTVILTLYHIDEELGNWTRAYILLDKIVKQELTYKEAHEICQDPQQLIPQLIDIFKQDDYLGAYTINKELEYAALDFIRNFNISENTDHAFTSKLNELDANTIYTFLVFGEQEIISNTFQKMYARLSYLTGNNFSPLLEQMNYKYVDQFARMVVHYGSESDFFRKVNDQQTLFAKIFQGLELSNKSEVESAIDAADIIVGMYDRNRLRDIQQIIRTEYERLELERNDKGVITYGILASILAQRLGEGWATYAAPYYKIPNLVSIPVYALFNDKLVNIQHYYFYNDRDGIYSYKNFIKQYERSSYNWEIKDLGSFIKITSKSGKSVEIYANKPEQGEDGISSLENYLKTNRLEPQIVVHRGLSTHTLKTFNRVPASAKLVLDGSCGGYHIQSVALEHAPGAHILCNRNIGTMYINDPMFMQISESIRQGKDIVWPSFWSEMEARLGTNPYFKDYIPPHKNVAALILKAYYDVLDINN
ncbi:MAG: hypothetical protein R2753_13865 [Chitinophagales bacterium]